MNGPFSAADILSALEGLLPIKAHYDKKDEVLLPILGRKGMPGPSRVMWNVDGEIRKSLQDLINKLKKRIPIPKKVTTMRCTRLFQDSSTGCER